MSDVLIESIKKRNKAYKMLRELIISRKKGHWAEGMSEEEAVKQAEEFLYLNDVVYKLMCDAETETMTEERPLEESEGA